MPRTRAATRRRRRGSPSPSPSPTPIRRPTAAVLAGSSSPTLSPNPSSPLGLLRRQAVRATSSPIAAPWSNATEAEWGGKGQMPRQRQRRLTRRRSTELSDLESESDEGKSDDDDDDDDDGVGGDGVDQSDDDLNPPNAIVTQEELAAAELMPYPKESPFVEEAESPFEFLYKPHTMTALALSLAAIMYQTFYADDYTPEASLKRGLYCVCIIFLTYCVAQLRDTVMVRPHPAVWRLVHGTAILYLLFLVYLLAQDVTAARHFLSHFYPELREQNMDNDKNYATDCRVYTPENPESNFFNVKDSVFDIFVLAHFLGAMGKTIILRDWKMAWVLLAIWEIVEYSFQHMLPNFMECWFDHWLVDVFGFNLAGMLLGLAICNYFSMQSYNWTGFDNRSGWTWRRVAMQFSPYEWTRYEWRMFSSPRRFFAIVVAMAFFEVAELNAFFLKYVLFIPPGNALNSLRLTMWGLLGMPAFREYYVYATDPRCKRLGPNVWLSLAILFVEATVIFKFGRKLPNFAIPFPAEVLWGWSIFFVCLSAWTVIRFNLLGVKWLCHSDVAERYALRTGVLKGLVVVAVLALTNIAISQDVGYGVGYYERVAEEESAAAAAAAAAAAIAAGTTA